MDAPAWVCAKLAEFHPYARIGWDGAKRRFGVIQLYHKRDAEQTFRESWGVRGPIFSRTGRPGYHDWDGLMRTPIYLLDATPQDVFSGKVLKDVKRWARPIAARVHADRTVVGRDAEHRIEAIGHEAGLGMFKEAQRSGAGAPIVAKKFARDEIAAYRKKNDRVSLANRVMPPEPPGGWEKHLKADQGDADNLGSVK